MTETVGQSGTVTLRVAEDALQRSAILYDKGGDLHYDLISAWIKSTRGSDPDASLLYLAAMLEGGEDPRFIARRMVVLASEDIGNADPRALEVAVSAAHAVEHVGLPECALNLAQAHERELTALLVKAWDKQGRLGAECAMRLEWQKKAIAIMLEYRENDANRGDDANITGDVVVCECKTCARAEALIALAVSDIGWWE